MPRIFTSAMLAAALAPSLTHAETAPSSAINPIPHARMVEATELGNNEIVEADEEREHFDIHLRNRPITLQLTLLAQQAERDIVIPEELSGSSSVDFFGVTLEQALNYTLLPCGGYWEDDGETITVFMPEEPDEDHEEENDAPEDEPVEPAETDTPPADPAAELNADHPGVFTLKVNDLKVTQVFQLLAIQSEMHFVVSGEIEDKVTCELENVTPSDVLDYIAELHDLRWVQHETCIWVMTQQQWQERFETEEGDTETAPSAE